MEGVRGSIPLSSTDPYFIRVSSSNTPNQLVWMRPDHFHRTVCLTELFKADLAHFATDWRLSDKAESTIQEYLRQLPQVQRLVRRAKLADPFHALRGAMAR